MPKVVYTATQGLVQQSGTGVQFESMPVSPIQSKTAVSGSVSSPGSYTLSGTLANQVVMPLASAVPGGVFVFRSTSADAHYLTGTLEANGTLVFAGVATGGASPSPTFNGHGSKLALPAVLGSSVSLISDGKSFCVMASSGSYQISGT